MGFINLPSLDDVVQEKDPKKQMEMLINAVGLLMKSLTEINGYLQSKNIMEVGGWRVTNTELKSKDGDVGMSTEDTAGDDIRFWAGGTNKEIAPWRVSKSGKMHATGATIESQGGYPKVIFEPISNFLKAAQDANHFVLVTPFSNGTPAIILYDGAISKTLNLFVHPDFNGSVISSLGNLQISAGSSSLILYGNRVTVPSWSSVVNEATGQTLQQALDAAMASPPPIPPG